MIQIYEPDTTITAESMAYATEIVRALEPRYTDVPGSPHARTLVDVTPAQLRALASTCYYAPRPAAGDIEYRPTPEGDGEIFVGRSLCGRDARGEIRRDGTIWMY